MKVECEANPLVIFVVPIRVRREKVQKGQILKIEKQETLLDIFWIAVLRSNPWVGGFFANLSHNFAFHSVSSKH